MTYYIVHNNEAIYGLGESADDAWADLRTNLGDTVLVEEDDAPPEDGANWSRISNFHVRAATPELITAVIARGGNVAWKIVCGIADLRK